MSSHFNIQNLGSIIQIFALSQRAIDWITNNLCAEPWQWVGNSVCIDSRYFSEINNAIKSDFLTAKTCNQ